MKTGFKDSLEVKNPKEKKNPWSFKAPEYDERSSCFVNAGSCYGVGHKQPIGKDRTSKKDVIPKGKISTMQTQKIYIDNLPYEAEDA